MPVTGMTERRADETSSILQTATNEADQCTLGGTIMSQSESAKGKTSGCATLIAFAILAAMIFWLHMAQWIQIGLRG